ncbi:hypothetical protein BFP72_02470 [Reichenbachiella sp. 5M10]|uniref:hypothetical protein n=1 Tax=Reichenbachiella sp. 5M10 TaxID=1889772 RepID=UPI000C15E993|nr:hypothetical protein [Reichenbachiella sp. 5M10]PIB34365.1 hypothetical protein BFP72_02470 [Reichenbachiella sp. 5M10]
MTDIQQRIEEAQRLENFNGLDRLFEELREKGTQEEKDALADAYMSIFSQCQYDYACGKFNEREDVLLLLDWVDKMRALSVEMSHYYYFLAHVHNMLSEVSDDPEEKREWADQAINDFKRQLIQTPEDSDVLEDIAKSLFRVCQIKGQFPREEMMELREYLLSALMLERKRDDQPGFYGFKGSAIHSYLITSYELLLDPTSRRYHDEFLQAMRDALMPHVQKHNPMVGYHWVDTLLRIARWSVDRKGIPASFIDDMTENLTKDLNLLIPHLQKLILKDEHFLSALGHLFRQLATPDQSMAYLDQAIDYYQQASGLNRKDWNAPYLAGKAAWNKYLWLLEKGEQEMAKVALAQGQEILYRAEANVEDFQLSLLQGELCYAYARDFEKFSNCGTLEKAKAHLEKSIDLGQQHYTQPYYELARVLLRLEGSEACLDSLRICRGIFSSEYHTHDFREIMDAPEFEELREEIIKIKNETIN